MKHLLITGAKGQLGQCFAAIAKHWPQFSFTFVSKQQVDITNKLDMAALMHKLKPYAVINCAAFTHVDLAEQQAELAYAVNATAVKQLAQLCVDTNSLLVHISTDYVFSGQRLNQQQASYTKQVAYTEKVAYTENDMPEPINVYGASKLAGEQAIQQSSVSSIIIRTSWLFSPFGTNFVKTISKLSQLKSELNVIDDQMGSPTYAIDLANAILTLLAQSVPLTQPLPTQQLYHFVNTGQASWCQFAQQIVELTASQCKVNAVSTQVYAALQQKTTQKHKVAPRPAYSVLDNTAINNKLQQLQQPKIQTWQAAVTKMLCDSEFKI